MSEHLARLAELYPGHLEEVGRRAAEALAACGYEALLLHSGCAPLLFRDDQSYPFRAQAPFKAWLPLTDVPDCFLWFSPGRTPVLAFHQPLDYWYRCASPPDSFWRAAFDVRVVPSREAARAALPQLSRTAFVGEAFPELLSFGPGAVNPQHLIERLEFPRARKTPYELECLREASRRGARGHLAAARAFAAGASEYAIHLAFLEATSMREQELPYNAIVAMNDAAAVLHYQMLERTAPAARHSLLIDAGVEAHGYASDITRTYSYEDAEFAALIGHLEEVQQSLCASVRAGTDWRDVHLSAHRLIAEVLKDADLIYADPDEALDSALSSVFFPHGLGHLLGLQVHDVCGRMRAPGEGEIPVPEGHPNLRLTRVLEPGFVVTVEPGIYFIDQLLQAARADRRAALINWSRVDSLRRFGGIRIEDDVVALEHGNENLTREAFRELAPGTA